MDTAGTFRPARPLGPFPGAPYGLRRSATAAPWRGAAVAA